MTDQTVEAEVVEDSNGQALERRPASTLAASDDMSVDAVMEQVNKIQDLMRRGMTEGEHYGTIPGTEKPTLYKAGAEKLCLMSKFDPEYEDERQFDADGHLTVTVTCTLYHIPTGLRVASGLGLCSTRESKYAYRKQNRVCPDCGAEAIIRGKAEFGGGWVCWKKRDGCGTKFSAGDERITSQTEGRVDNPDLADSFNTVLKMSAKRALCAAVLNGTAASDLFTQDIGDPEEADAPPVEDAVTRGPTTESAREKQSSANGGPTDKQLQYLGRLLEDVGYDKSDRDGRVAFVSNVVGRPVDSARDLTKRECSELIDGLKAVSDGEKQLTDLVPKATEAGSGASDDVGEGDGLGEVPSPYPADGSVDDVQEWVGESEARAIEAWLKEHRRKEPRKGVLNFCASIVPVDELEAAGTF